MRLKKLLKKILIVGSACSFVGCYAGLDIDPKTIDADAMILYVRPTNPKRPNQDIDISKPDNFKKFLDKHTCFSADDGAQIKRKLNQCK